MPHIFRHFIEQTLFNAPKTSVSNTEQITITKLSNRLKTLIQQSLQPNQMTISKFAANLQKDNKDQVKIQPLQKNEIYIDSLKEVSEFIFKLAYGHPGLIFYPKYNIDNVIGFYEISKNLIHVQGVFTSVEMKKAFNQEVIGLLFTQKIQVYKDVYYRIEESSVFKNFVDELFKLIQQRIKHFFNLFGLNPNKDLIKVCESHIRSFIEVYQLTDSVKLSKYGSQQLIKTHRQMTMQQSRNLLNSTDIQSEVYLNTISIDEIIICFVFLIYRMSHEYTNVSMCKLLKGYFGKILKWKNYKKNDRIMELYNNCYLKLFIANRLEKINKHQVNFNSDVAEEFQADLVENGGTILDNFVSSFEN